MVSSVPSDVFQLDVSSRRVARRLAVSGSEKRMMLFAQHMLNSYMSIYSLDTIGSGKVEDENSSQNEGERSDSTSCKNVMEVSPEVNKFVLALLKELPTGVSGQDVSLGLTRGRRPTN